MSDPNQLRADPRLFSGLEYLAPGVIGYTIEKDGVLWIPFIAAENPGSGQVGRYLDALPRDHTICVPNVLSSRLAGMLARRGFRLMADQCEELGTNSWERRPG